MSPAALVTGGGTGIGAAVARRLAADGYGVAVAGRRLEPLAQVADEIGGIAVAGDCGEPAGAETAVRTAVEELGGLDALVYCAGVSHSGSVVEQTPESWDAVLRTNLTGAFLTARAALPHLEQRGGSVVAVSSLAGLRAGPDSSAYCTSKAGLNMLVQSIAVDFGPRGVRANAVCPGWIRTPMADGAMDELAGHPRHRPRGRLPAGARPHAHPARRRGRRGGRAGGLAALARGGLRQRHRDPGRRRRERARPGPDGVPDVSTVANITVPSGHFIGGERVDGDETFEVISPIDQRVIAEVARGDQSAVDRAVDAARAAFPEWAALGPEGRAVRLHRLAELIDASIDRIATVECLDMAMLERSLKARVIARGARNFRAYADLAASYQERVWGSNSTRNRVIRMPSGPAAVITPWNAPFMLSTWKTAPGLAAGCTVILKPPEWAPLSCSLLADLTAEAGFPPGVFNVVQGIGEEAGAALVSSTGVRRISFTGSPETGRSIGLAAAANIVPFTAELGGKGPLIVFADSDLDAAAAKAAGQYDDAGQVCLAGTRLLVEESVRDAFLERFHAGVDAQVLGDPRDDRTTISPLIHPDHLARVEGFVERARANGDTIVRGGRQPDMGGLWYEPTLIEPRSNDSEVVQREVFGPVLTFQTFRDEAQAIELANSTRYGLSAIIYTGTQERAERVGRAVRAGTVWVNTFLVRDLTAPFGGVGISGIGREGGDYALDFYSDLKTLQILDGSTA